mgnify:CR=1 FL=1
MLISKNEVDYLLNENIIFDYATQFYYSHPTIGKANTFTLSEKEFKEFITYAMKRDFDYTTGSEKMVERLKEMADKEGYYQSSKEKKLSKCS